MDRRSQVHLSSRVLLPQSVLDYDNSVESTGVPVRDIPIFPRFMGIFAFVTCAAVVIVTASFLALSV